jgi:iron-sulfur cluster repair protein YtfE (RIC family)
MLYNVYKNVSDEKYESLQERLEKLEEIVTPMMSQFGFQLSRKGEGLGLDYVSEDSNGFMGNIGFSFDDLKEKKSFTFYVLKVYDLDNKRFYKRGYLCEEVDLAEIEKQVQKLFENAISKYKSWQKEDLANYIIIEP